MFIEYGYYFYTGMVMWTYSKKVHITVRLAITFVTILTDFGHGYHNHHSYNNFSLWYVLGDYDILQCNVYAVYIVSTQHTWKWLSATSIAHGM